MIHELKRVGNFEDVELDKVADRVADVNGGWRLYKVYYHTHALLSALVISIRLLLQGNDALLMK